MSVPFLLVPGPDTATLRVQNGAFVSVVSPALHAPCRRFLRLHPPPPPVYRMSHKCSERLTSRPELCPCGFGASLTLAAPQSLLLCTREASHTVIAGLSGMGPARRRCDTRHMANTNDMSLLLFWTPSGGGGSSSRGLGTVEGCHLGVLASPSGALKISTGAS